jgi:hypothetical protein
LAVVGGGPGTGKKTTVRRIVALLTSARRPSVTQRLTLVTGDGRPRNHLGSTPHARVWGARVPASLGAGAQSPCRERAEAAFRESQAVGSAAVPLVLEGATLSTQPAMTFLFEPRRSAPQVLA